MVLCHDSDMRTLYNNLVYLLVLMIFAVIGAVYVLAYIIYVFLKVSDFYTREPAAKSAEDQIIDVVCNIPVERWNKNNGYIFKKEEMSICLKSDYSASSYSSFVCLLREHPLHVR